MIITFCCNDDSDDLLPDTKPSALAQYFLFKFSSSLLCMHMVADLTGYNLRFHKHLILCDDSIPINLYCVLFFNIYDMFFLFYI